jgi:hypothetical protein
MKWCQFLWVNEIVVHWTFQSTTNEEASHFDGKNALANQIVNTLHDDMEGTCFKDFEDTLWVVSVTKFTIIYIIHYKDQCLYGYMDVRR